MNDANKATSAVLQKILAKLSWHEDSGEAVHTDQDGDAKSSSWLISSERPESPTFLLDPATSSSYIVAGPTATFSALKDMFPSSPAHAPFSCDAIAGYRNEPAHLSLVNAHSNSSATSNYWLSAQDLAPIVAALTLAAPVTRITGLLASPASTPVIHDSEMVSMVRRIWPKADLQFRDEVDDEDGTRYRVLYVETGEIDESILSAKKRSLYEAIAKDSRLKTVARQLTLSIS